MPDSVNDVPQVVAVEREGDAPPVVLNIPWWKVIMVRALRAALTTFAGLQSASVLVPADLPHGSTMLLALKVSAFAALMSAVLNGGELLLQVDKNYPGFRA